LLAERTIYENVGRRQHADLLETAHAKLSFGYSEGREKGGGLSGTGNVGDETAALCAGQ